MIYESKCNKCGKMHEYVRPVALFKDTPMCCGVKTIKQISIPMIQSSTARVFENYKCPETGDVVTSDKQRNEIMAKHDLIDARETGTGKEHIKKANKIQAAKDAITDNNVSVGWQDLKTT